LAIAGNASINRRISQYCLAPNDMACRRNGGPVPVMGNVEQLRAPIARVAAVLQRGGKFILETALPPLCPSCRAPLGDGVGLCAACWSKLSLIEPPYCARLGIPFTYDPGPGLLSMEAIADPPAYDRARGGTL
jgi:Double zinc ribbon domain